MADRPTRHSAVEQLFLIDPATGSPYDAKQLPCTADPHLWDADATKKQKNEARQRCAACPACAECYARRLELKTAADGVWGGTVIHRSTRDKKPPSDPAAEALANEFGIPLPTQRKKKTDD